MIIWLEIRLPTCSLWVTSLVKPIHSHSVPKVELFYFYTCTGGCSHYSQMLGQTELL